MQSAREYLSEYSDKEVRTFRTSLVPDKVMRRVLGRNCYKLFVLFIRESNSARFIDISIKEVCEKLSIKQHTASYNIGKLVNLGILGTGVKRKNRTSRRQIFAELDKSGSWRVPDSTYKQVVSAPLHGGRRTKSLSANNLDETKTTTKGECCTRVVLRSSGVGPRGCSDPTNSSLVSCQDLESKLSRPDLPSYCINSSYYSLKNSSFLKERRGRTFSFTRKDKYNMNKEYEQSAGSPFPEIKTPPPPRAWEGTGVPPFPSNELVGMAYRPSPPEVKEGMTDKEKVELLVKAYKGAVKSRYGKSDYSMRGNLEQHRNFKALLSAANMLMEKGVAPAVWVMWKFDQSIAFWEKVDADPEFADKHKSKKRPKKYSPIYIVYTKSSISKQAGWCRSESVKYRDGQTYFSPTHKKVTVLWKKMDADLRSECPLTDRDTRDVVARTFPGTLYNELVAKAAQENKDKQDRWNYLANTGVFIW